MLKWACDNKLACDSMRHPGVPENRNHVPEGSLCLGNPHGPDNHLLFPGDV